MIGSTTQESRIQQTKLWGYFIIQTTERYLCKKTKMRPGEDAQHVKVLAVKPEDLSLIS